MKLSDEAQKWHDKIQTEYAIDDEPGKLLLQMALECFDEMRTAQEQMDGSQVYTDRFGQPREHPAAKVCRSARTQMMSAFRQLKLEINPDL